MLREGGSGFGIPPKCAPEAESRKLEAGKPEAEK
jgi:hypothetical protein